jgi:hypothetical protein
MLVVTSFVGNPSVISFHVLSLLSGLGRKLVIFTSCLPCQVWGSPWESVNMFVEFVSLGDPSRGIFIDGAGMHEYLLCSVLDCGSAC